MKLIKELIEVIYNIYYYINILIVSYFLSENNDYSKN